MAFQSGEVKIKGTYDGLSFYESEFGWLVRTKGGPTSKRYRTAPEFARSRENSSEFGACSPMAAKVRRLVIEHTGIKDPTLFHRLMTLMRHLVAEDKISARGHRSPEIGLRSTSGLALLDGFRLEGGHSLTEVLIKAGLVQTISVSNGKSNNTGRRRKTQYTFNSRQAIGPLNRPPHTLNPIQFDFGPGINLRQPGKVRRGSFFNDG